MDPELAHPARPPARQIWERGEPIALATPARRLQLKVKPPCHHSETRGNASHPIKHSSSPASLSLSSRSQQTCLLFSCQMGFVIRSSATTLSMNDMVGHFYGLFKLFSNALSQYTSLEQVCATTYSALVDASVTVVCFLDFQVTAQPFSIKQTSATDILASLFRARLASL